jgi:hypothetical protein
MRDKKLNKYIRYYIIGLLFGALFFVVALLFGDLYTLVGFIDAITLSTVVLFAVGWFLLISNVGSLDILYYGVKAFAKAVIGKRMKNTYYDYTTNKEEVPKEVLWGLWLASFTYLIILIVLYSIYLS